MQQNKLDFGAFIRDANGNYAMARPATEAELIAQASAILQTRLRGEPLSSRKRQKNSCACGWPRWSTRCSRVCFSITGTA